DVYDGLASFSDVLFRDLHSRVHYVPPGKRHLTPAEIGDDRLETILSALTLTYDQVVIDARDDVIGKLAPAAQGALAVSEYPGIDMRTERALAGVRTVSAAEIPLLVIEAGEEGGGLPRAPRVAEVA